MTTLEHLDAAEYVRECKRQHVAAEWRRQYSEKLSAAIKSTTIKWRDGTVLQGNFVQLKRKDAIVLLQLLTKTEDKAAPDLSNLAATA